MESLTPIEALIYSNLDLNEAVETAEHAAVNCQVAGITAQIAKRETRLALIRYHQAQNKLAQVAQEQPEPLKTESSTMIATEVELPELLFRCLQALLVLYPNESIDSLFIRALEAYLRKQSV